MRDILEEVNVGELQLFTKEETFVNEAAKLRILFDKSVVESKSVSSSKS